MAEPRYIVADGQVRPGVNLSGSTIPARRIVKVGAADDQIQIATDGLDAVQGITLEDIPSGRTGDVQITGRVLVEAAGAIAKDHLIAADSTGRAVSATPAQHAAGRAIYATGGAGQFVEAELAQDRIEAFSIPLVASAWLRNTTLSGLIASVSDQINVNPATQAVAADQPTGNADGSMTWGAVDPDLLLWPITAQNHGTTVWWIAMAIESPLSTLARAIWRVLGANGGVFLQVSATEQLLLDLNVVTAASVRRYSTAASIIGATRQFITCEIDLTRPTEAAMVVITRDLVEETLTPSNQLGAPNGPPTVLVQNPGGSVILGSNSTSGSGGTSFTGTWAPDVVVGVSSIAGLSRGCLSPEVRRALKAIVLP